MRFSLNYVWIQAARLPVPKEGQTIMCPIPNKLMENVVNIAEKYPNMPVTIWTDIYGIGNHPECIMQDLSVQQDQPNINFKALDSIPAYTTNPLFEKTPKSFEYPEDPIWKQVDLARLYVLRECIINGTEEAAIYCDMDIIFSERMATTLEKFGVVTLATTTGLGVENGMIGISKSKTSFLTETLLPITADYIKQGSNGYRGHIQVFSDLSPHLIDAGIEYSDVVIEAAFISDHQGVKSSYQSGNIKLLSAQSVPQPS